MTKIIAAIVGIIAIIGVPIASLDYLDGRYVERKDITIANDLPKGTILSWYANTGSVPNGWAICDGSNGTPDLRNKFLRGVASFGDVGKSGGHETFRTEEFELTVYASGWDSHFTEHPNGGPKEHQSWENRRWHRLVSKGKLPATEVQTVPPYKTVLFIMKIDG